MQGKVVLVTGAARGIGLACAERFAREGASVALLDLDDEAGQAAEMALRGSGASAIYIRCDVGLKTEVDRAIGRVVDVLGRIDILVNNAGINRTADFLDYAEEDFDLVLRTNLKSVFLVGQAAARHMVSAGIKGAIINMSSGNAVMTGPNLAAYAASKGAISSLTKVMALSLAPRGIRVNAIGPGTIMTEMTRTRLWDNIETRRMILSRTPLGRFGDPSDVAGMAVYLASEDAAFVTGQTFFLDGGRNVLNYTVPTA